MSKAIEPPRVDMEEVTRLASGPNLAAQGILRDDPVYPGWRRLFHDDHSSLADAASEIGCVFPPPEEGFEEDENFIYLPVSVLIRPPYGQEDDDIRQETITFALGDGQLVTIEPRAGYAPFDRAPAILRRRPDLKPDAHGIMYALLQATNSAGHQIVEYASGALERMNMQIHAVTAGIDADGHEITTDDIATSLNDLNAKEELISRIQEGQLLLERAARYLRLEADSGDHALREQLDMLISDIGSVKEHAGFEHDKVRYLQQSVTASLNAKQNQVVKVFTIITAVFLPPTLIASLYGMNFAVMPELSWKHGFTATIALTLAAALLPLWYIKRKGWLR